MGAASGGRRAAAAASTHLEGARLWPPRMQLLLLLWGSLLAAARGAWPAPMRSRAASGARDAAASAAHCCSCLHAHLLVSASPRTLPSSTEQWDKVENKTSVVVYGAGSIVVLWLASTIVGALNSIPLVSLGGRAQRARAGCRPARGQPSSRASCWEQRAHVPEGRGVLQQAACGRPSPTDDRRTSDGSPLSPMLSRPPSSPAAAQAV